MQNFVFYNPTKIVFGHDTVSQIGTFAAQYGKKALLVYGFGSIKKNGLYDKVVKSLRDNQIEFVEYFGVKANPILTHTEAGIALAKKEKVDMIIPVGGGSVIDESKAIAAGALVDFPVWNFYARKNVVEKALPILTVLTLAATGTEMNGRTVITNEATQEKLVIGADPLFPKVSILDPTATFSVPKDQTAYGAIDAASHLMEEYFTQTDRVTPIQDRYTEGLVRTLVDVAARCQQNPDDYQARASLMWSASLAWNGLATSGVGPWFTPNHLIGMGMSALYDTPHGATIAISFTHWLPWYAKQNEANAQRVAHFGREVFGVENADLEKAVEQSIAALKAWYQSLGSPVTPAEAGIDDQGMKNVAKQIESVAHFWNLPTYNAEFVLSLYQ